MPAKIVPCPNCKNGIVKLSTVTGRFDKAISCLNRGEVARATLGFLKALAGLAGTAENSLVMCDTCNNKRSITDTTDNSTQYKQVAQNLEKNTEKISELESKLGKGGDEIKITTGDMAIQCGLIMNDTPSYRIDNQASPTRGNVVDGAGVKPGKGTMWTGGGKTNAIVGLNPLPTPGGEYTLVCTNKYRLVVGNRGVEIKTGGPVTIDGGITRITGPQVTIGTSTGRLVLEGEVVNINGTSIEMTPSGKGQVVVGGTLGVTGNSIVGGHLHTENISFVGATCTAKNETSTTSSATDIITGPARWSGHNNAIFKTNNSSGLALAINDLLAHTITTTSDVRKIAQLLFNRAQNQLLDKMSNIFYNFSLLEHNSLSVPPIGILPRDIASLPRKHDLTETGYVVIYNTLLGEGNPYGDRRLWRNFWAAVRIGQELPSNFVKKVAPFPGFVGVVFSPPHVHAIHDGEHSHTHKAPNIQLKDAPEEVRAASSGAQSNATKSSSFESLASSFLASISKSYPQVYSIFSRINPFK